jgi:thermostable 8-oxoguanine DNA glycosylase
VGPKTAQFFLVHSREGYEGVILDTHILKYLNDKGFDAPSQTPQNMDKYNALSKQFLYISSTDYPLLSAAQRDLLIWRKYSGRE